MGEPGWGCSWLPSSECIGWWGCGGEVKHLSTCCKRYSVSSGERKRRRLNRVCVIVVGRCIPGVVGIVCGLAGVGPRSDKTAA